MLMMDNDEKDLIIIGAGINGLSAGLAYALNNDLKKKQVVIIEKNPSAAVTSLPLREKAFNSIPVR